MIYTILKYLCKITLSSYFKRIRIVGKENIPVNAPCVFIANHPSAFMDPIVVATTLEKPVYFIAAGEYVGTGVKGLLFKKLLHMIPVFRPSTRPEDVHKNKKMFDDCFQHLANDGNLLIFPEGVSITERKVKPLKTGVARIARGAEVKNSMGLNLHVIPVGLNYSDPHQFRSDLFVNIGKAIRVSDFITLSEKKEAEEIDKLTEIFEQALQNAVLHSDEEVDTLLTKLNTIYSRDLKRELDLDYKEQEREFVMQKEMIEAIEYFRTYENNRFKQVEQAIESYWNRLAENGLSDKDIKEIKVQKSFRRIGTYILGFPFFLLGFLNNFVPYFFVQTLVPKIRIHENFRGSMILSVGLFSFLLFYISLAVCLGIFTPLGIWAILYPVVMYVSGIYALVYLTAMLYTKKRKNLRRLLKSNKVMLVELVAKRKELIELLTSCRHDFEISKSEKAN